MRSVNQLPFEAPAAVVVLAAPAAAAVVVVVVVVVVEVVLETLLKAEPSALLKVGFTVAVVMIVGTVHSYLFDQGGI
jgi:hypothetical protein